MDASERRWATAGLGMLAAALGWCIAWVDPRPTWDDTGVTAIALVVVAAALGWLRPQRPWVWALLIGGWIPLLESGWRPQPANGGVLPSLAVAGLGAYAGAFGRRLQRGLG
jgi:hypothetical protein